MRTQVVIIGAGPAGLLLSHLLAKVGIGAVIVENRSRTYVEQRIRAGILEASSVELLESAGVGDRLRNEGMEHRGIYVQWPGHRQHLDFADLVGRGVWVYGQTEVTKDLGAARDADGQVTFYGAADVTLHDVDSENPYVTFVDESGVETRIDAQVIAGCDGFHGPSRASICEATVFEREYPFAWLGVLADVAPSTDELIYAWHPDGFALHSMRSHEVSRFYLQVDPAEDIAEWPDDRIWSELRKRLGYDGWELQTGEITEKSVLPMRSFVSTPMRQGRLFLAGDSAHIVPPTGAKGLNLAIADVGLLAPALGSYLTTGSTELIDAYSDTALRRVWRCTHFSWWMTTTFHQYGDAFDDQLQLSQLRLLASSKAAAMGLAENYAGLPIGY
ncbi:MAG: 4-hydroxybenzoate 3-monooxygenase [Propionibacteriales bacterium]|nr:4-hydroxybenzoate 3-monooxygenase [Propionibacteriales bacterium]